MLCLNHIIMTRLIVLLSTQLESTAKCAYQRMRQLKKCFNIVAVAQRPEDRTVIFAGDLNLRDEEVSRIGGLPVRVMDVWEEPGSRYEVKFAKFTILS